MPKIEKGYWQVIAAMLIWGSVGIFVRLAEQAAPVIVFFRVSIACAALGFYLWFKKEKLDLGRHWRLAILSGVTISLNWLFYFKAIQTTTIGNAVLTYYMAPIFSIIWANLFLGEKLEKRALYALGLSACGIVLMMSGYEFSLTSSDFVGILYGLTGATFYSLVVVMAKYMAIKKPTHLVIVQMAVASIIFLPQMLITPFTLTLPSVTALAIMGLVHSALALGIYFTGLKSVKVQHAGILSYTDPVSALLLAYLVFGEQPTLFTALGGAVVLAASYLVVVPVQGNQSKAD